jgi:hypothetical protein
MEPREWRIEYVNGPPDRFQLVNCKIYRDASGDYQFLGPRGTVRATRFSPGNVPFNLPVFTAPLNGTVDRSWYIRVTHVDDQQMRGTWSNTQYEEPHRRPNEVDDNSEAEPDTWTALAHQGAQFGHKDENKEKEKEKEAAASAAPKL